jgi:hypothetical protein
LDLRFGEKSDRTGEWSSGGERAVKYSMGKRKAARHKEEMKKNVVLELLISGAHPSRLATNTLLLPPGSSYTNGVGWRWRRLITVHANTCPVHTVYISNKYLLTECADHQSDRYLVPETKASEKKNPLSLYGFRRACKSSKYFGGAEVHRSTCN